MPRFKDGRPRVATPLTLDPLPYVSWSNVRLAKKGSVLTEFAPRDGYSKNEEDYE